MSQEETDLLSLFTSLDNEDTTREKYIYAPFPYPGGKSASLNKILPHLPQRSSYVEHFGGSGAVLLSRNESKLETFNDRFSGVTCFYRVIRDPILEPKLLERLHFVLHSREEFIFSRDTWESCQDPIERAARWWYSVTCSFSGQGRNFGRCKHGKSQMGPKLKSNLKLFHDCHVRLRNVQIENLDWRQSFKDFDSADTVHYCDPTYYEYCKGMYQHEMTKDDHHEMLERIFHLEGFVAVSGYSHPVYDKMPWDNKVSWKIPVTALAQSFTGSNNLEGKEDILKRGYAEECLYIKESKG